MIKNILRDLINTRKIASFINDIMVGKESEEGYNELVEEILRKMKANDLNLKLKKCKWNF